ncbi:MAG TPA: hypothetical protein DCX54_03770 [Flavobacteriales bacterium]|nr:hypothetical protein [Flavobacteriales bacterium]
MTAFVSIVIVCEIIIGQTFAKSGTMFINFTVIVKFVPFDFELNGEKSPREIQGLLTLIG